MISITTTMIITISSLPAAPASPMVIPVLVFVFLLWLGIAAETVSVTLCPSERVVDNVDNEAVEESKTQIAIHHK